ncbi:guanylate kinase [Dethiosulfatarculus sandiegensis]|uniref:Guanylate kinase n=1 Tax=Dethiosulfatarculus sandiegensis TaxID=1429043 RepID=A0A0D2J3X7_9BACT|nr:guanylate kinase [Dethiosulfatarculus sandiegensis]KIX12879.1 guanylate kinase [Dethiosulfatarculus sandiegensis]
MSQKGRIFVLSAPSGTGKSTVGERVRQRLPRLAYSVSVTTRKPRPGEEHGKDYFFVSVEDFKKRIARGEMAEYAEVYGNYYGTSALVLEELMDQGKDVFLDIEIKGAAQIRKSIKDACLIFLLPPSLEELEKRLRSRGTETEEEIKKRLDRVTLEMEQAPLYDYRVVNDDLEKAVEEVCEIIAKGSLGEGR